MSKFPCMDLLASSLGMVSQGVGASTMSGGVVSVTADHGSCFDNQNIPLATVQDACNLVAAASCSGQSASGTIYGDAASASIRAIGIVNGGPVRAGTAPVPPVSTVPVPASLGKNVVWIVGLAGFASRQRRPADGLFQRVFEWSTVMRAIFLSSVLACLLPTGGHAQAPQRPVDLRILTQTWDPVTDADDVMTALDRDGAISEIVLKAWDLLGPIAHDKIVAALEQGDLLAPGFTLYDIALTLPQPTLTLAGASGTGPWAIRSAFDIRGLYFRSSITQPTILGDFADPTCELRADLRINFQLVFGNGSGSVIDVQWEDPAKAVEISNFSWDSQGVVCGGIEAFVSLLDLRSAIKAVVEGPVVETPVSLAVVKEVAPVVQELNALVAGVTPPDSRLSNLWFTDVAGKPNQRLTLAFAPRGPFPDTSDRGRIAGTVRLAPGTTLSCANLGLAAARKSGPRPIVNPAGALGDAPREPIATDMECARRDDGSFGWSLSGLSTGFRNFLTFPSMTSGCDGGRAESTGTFLDPAAWPVSGQGILPAELSEGFDLIARRVSFRCPPQIDLQAEVVIQNPLLDPDYSTRGIEFLNPQPLPPEYDAFRLQSDLIRLQNQVISLQNRLMDR